MNSNEPGKPLWQAKCSWPEATLPFGTTTTYSDHLDHIEACRAIVVIRQGGYAGEGKVFPLRTWVVNPEGVEMEIVREGDALVLQVPSNPVKEYTARDVMNTMKATEGVRIAPAQEPEPELEGRKRGNRHERRAAASRARKARGVPDVVVPVREPTPRNVPAPMAPGELKRLRRNRVRQLLRAQNPAAYLNKG